MRHTLIIPLLVASCLVPAGVFAQRADGPIEISGGLSSLASGACCLPMTGTVPLGWDTGVAVRLREWFSVVGAIGGDYETLQLQATAAPASHTRVYAFLGGPRVAIHGTQSVSVFGQVLLGATHHEAAFNDPSIPLVGYSSVNHFAWQPGGGVDISVGKRWAVRFEGDYRVTPIQGLVPPRTALTQSRFTSGIVFRP